jgi:excinuclease ABC subunit A
VIVDASKPLLDGALGPGAGSAYMTHRIREAASRLKIDLNQCFENLSKKAQTLLLEGGNGFPGLLKVLDEAFEEAGPGYREWLMDYMSPSTCSACQGRRLKPSSQAVQVKGQGISELTEMSIARALEAVRSWQLLDREKQIAGRVVEEIENRLQFLVAVGLSYLSLARSASTLSGGEAQRIRLDCIPAITTGCSKLSRICEIWATRCWWWSTTPRPSCAPIT